MALTPSAMKLKPGDAAPDFSGLGCAKCGKAHSLDELRGEKATVVIFMCNHCPYVKAKLEAMKQLHSQYSAKGVSFVGISSNDPVDYPEDNFDGMKKAVAEGKVVFHYLFDESQEVARAYGATCTPDPFLFNASLKLAYHGRLNDAMEPGQTATSNDMADAIDALLAGKRPPREFIASIGCSIKWKG